MEIPKPIPTKELNFQMDLQSKCWKCPYLDKRYLRFKDGIGTVYNPKGFYKCEKHNKWLKQNK